MPAIEFLTLNNIQLTGINLNITSEQVKRFFVRIYCQSGYFLSAIGSDNVTIEASLLNVNDYTNIVTTPLDLDAYDGEYRDFEIKITSDVITEFILETYKIFIKRANV